MANILTIIPYTFYPPTSGGALRCFYLLREMAKEHIVYVLSPQSNYDYVINDSLDNKNIHIISVDQHFRYKSFINYLLPSKYANAINYRFLRRNLIGSANDFYLNSYPVLSKLLKQVKFDLVNYESLEALFFFRDNINRLQPNVKHLYDAHNVDSELWIQQAKVTNSVRLRKYAANALQIESTLYRTVDCFFCCSSQDYIKLRELNKHKIDGIVVPNGVEISTRPFDTNPSKCEIRNILFCGSLDYFPNEQALIWFYNAIFNVIKKNIPELTLTIIGRGVVSEKLNLLKSDTSIRLIGEVDSVIPYYKQASVAIVPLLQGSGTRLKILEAMSLGNPIVSTSIGAEGIGLKKGNEIMIADTAHDFANKVSELLINKTLFDEVRNNANHLVNDSFDWRIIGKLVNNSLNSISKSQTISQQIN